MTDESFLVELGADSSAVGNKAARIGELHRIGVRVPKTKVVPFSVVSRVTGRDTFEITGELRDCLVQSLSRDFGGGPVVVRSSGSMEDNAFSSCSGLYDTFLNITDEKSLVRAVEACVASLRNNVALAYADLHGIPSSAIRMAIIIQEMVAPTTSGVLFTQDPLCGGSDRMRLEWCPGVGTDVVAGRPGVSAATLPRTAEEAPEAALHPLHERLRSVGLALEAHFGRPQDIEWGEVNGVVTLFQSRDITAYSRPGGDRPGPVGAVEGGPARGLSCGLAVGRLAAHAEPASAGLEILVLEEPPSGDYDFARIERASGVIITSQSGALSHFSSILRELGKPAAVVSVPERLYGETAFLDAHDGQLLKLDELPALQTKELIFAAMLGAARCGTKGLSWAEKCEGVATDPVMTWSVYRQLAQISEPVFDGTQKLYPFDEPSRSSYCQVSARIQEAGDNLRVQFKRWEKPARSGPRHDTEVYVALEDIEQGRRLLASLGYAEFDAQDRHTVEYRYRDCRFYFYRWPNSARWYLSVEAQDPAHLSQAISSLGYPDGKLEALDGKTLFGRLGLQLSDCRSGGEDRGSARPVRPASARLR